MVGLFSVCRVSNLWQDSPSHWCVVAVTGHFLGSSTLYSPVHSTLGSDFVSFHSRPLVFPSRFHRVLTDGRTTSFG